MMGGKFDVFDGFQLHSQIYFVQLLKHYSVYRCMVKDSDHLSKYFKSEYPSKFHQSNFYRDVPTVVGTNHHSDQIATTTNLLISTKISTPMKMFNLNCQRLYVTHTHVHM